MIENLDPVATEIMLLRDQLKFEQVESKKFREALERIALCNWPGPHPIELSRADWMQQVVREALE
jgi:hypothetical protein